LTRVFAGIGSNVGDRIAFLRAAVDELGGEVVAVSPVYETEPVGPDQPDFLNAVVELETEREPRELLEAFKRIEHTIGRSPGERWGPREIDIDLLTYGDSRLDEPDLRIPHLGLVRRAFVLVPLADLAPDLDVPGAGTVAQLLERLDTSGVRPTGLSLY
jgi:2-amino-4-hydroxy-6-hydroxymethyldihydropteridine diphosphokinase